MKTDDRSSGAPMDWLFADIGGTNARFGRWRSDRGLGVVRRWPADDFAGLADAVGAFEGMQPERARHAALAVAVRVRDESMKMTNRGWRFDARTMRSHLGLQTLHVVNDFVAAAAGLPALEAGAARTIRAGRPASDHLLLIGPGTGLGAAALLDAGKPHERVLASEAGHMGFASDDRELAPAIEAARTRWPRLSWERLLNGEGLAVLHAWQAHVASGGSASDAPAIEARARSLSAPDVATLVQAGDPAARRTAYWFSRLLGSFAGDLCLAFGAEGGVWLTGGVLEGMARADGFDESAFLEAFDDKGRYAARQREVPVRHVLADDLAFRGLTRITEGACHAPGLLVTEHGIDERH